METRPGKQAIWTVLLLCLALGAGCTASAPTRYYLLSPMETGSQEEERDYRDARCVAIGIGPVELPTYLDRAEMMTRVKKNKLELSELHHWAEPLQENFNRVLADNLDTQLCTSNIAVFPWRSSSPIDYRVEADIIRFEPTEDGSGVLLLRWSVFDQDRKRIIHSRRARYTQPISGEGHAAVAAALSRATAELSRDMARFLRRHVQNGRQGNGKE